MRILHITKKYPNALGGDAIVVQNLEKQQKKNGHEVFILTTNCNEIQNKKKLTKFGLKDTPTGLDKITFKRIFSLIGLYFKSKKILKEVKPDIVHSHSIDMGFIISRVCKKINIPLIHTCHGVTFNNKKFSKLKRKLDLFLLKSSNFEKILTVDSTSIKDFKKRSFSATYIPNGTELTIKKTRRHRKQLNILFVGRLEKQKGLIYLINAINILKNKNLNFKINIVGGGSLKKFLKGEIKKKELGKYFNFLGYKTQKELSLIYQNSDIFISPSLWEGFPITLLEAWNYSLPVIITKVGAIPNICKNEKDSLIINPKDSRQLAMNIERLIKNKILRKRIGGEGRKLIKQKYNWRKINRNLEKIYSNIIEENKK